MTIPPPLRQDPPRPPAIVALRDDLREMFQELVQYRELLLTMTRRDLLLRYKQTIMGFGWSILMPVTYMIVFSLIFTRVVKLETDVPYPIYAYAGLLPWNFFASSLRFAVGSLTANSTLVTKVYFPREILPFSVVLVSLVDFAVGALVLAGLMAWYGVAVHWTVLLLPVVVLVQILFTAGVTLLLAMGNLFFRDVKYLLEILITLWMFATSVVYPVERIGGRLGELLALNPMTPIIEAYRAILLHGTLPAAGPFAWAAAVSVVLLAVSWLAFHRAEFRFAESI
ncbi:MAG: ABC transporter permease [Candidatus Eisenbacteria bacterium]|nr:ABC transporter permease [Candidatus Eisenbacteria bacterium]